MPKCYSGGPRLRRAFIVTSYVPGPDGVPLAVVPPVCIQGAGPDGLDCAVTIDHLRQRKTGPTHPLAVARCSVHGCGYTLYPPAYAPYRRQQVVKIAPDETPILSEEEGLGEDYADTVFAAALDGADGVAWARSSDATIPEHWWSTQRRHLRLAARLVGVARNLDDWIRESIASVLSASGLWQREHSGAKGYRALGTAVCGILKRLRGGHGARAFALLVCGHLAGLWGEPIRWDSCRQDLVRSPFCRRGTTTDT